MAHSDDDETPRKKRKGKSLVVWLLMGLLILGLGGFGVTNFGGGVTAIGQVGDREIDVNAYSRALQQELAAFGAQVGTTITLQQAQSLGLDRQVRQQLITRAALDNEAARVGISVGDARVAQEITGIRAFQGTAGSFDPEAYRFTLERNNLTVTDFESGLRDDLARSLLQGAVVGGFAAPAVLTETLHAYVAERRGLTLLRLSAADLPDPLPTPAAEDLQAHYAANIAAFTRPEARRITYAALLPEALAAGMPVDEAGVRALYDERIDQFVQPERRLVERLVFPTDADAEAAKARLDAGESFETLVAERGLAIQDTDMGDVSRQDLGAAAEAVFALTGPGVAGPLASDLGPAVFRMNAILAAQETPFEDARADLATEFQLDAARRAISDRTEAINDALAGGATLEDLAAEQQMSLETIDFTSASDEGIAGYPVFREAAAKVAEGDFPEAIILADGGLVALRLDAIVPPTPIPFDEAQDAVLASWQAEATAKALTARAEAIRAEVAAGASLGSYGILDVTPGITRDGFIEDTPDTLLATAFRMAEAELRVIEGPDFVGLLRLDSIQPTDPAGQAAVALKASIAAQAEQALAQDAFTLFSAALSDEAGITLNEAAINAVHAQFQ
ncbi:SurA N-terminal domain-containing protein [Paracoccaceae bacterium Fryx2]|nr:SurA N-terminal domain-containing protein [Paracoccaceae bacterium Fryx2]